MRNELVLLKNVWPAVFLGTALVSGCGGVDASPAESSGSGPTHTVMKALEEGAQGPDLVVTSLEAPRHVRPGEELPVKLTVCNRGTLPANAMAGLYLTPEASISPSDPFLVQTFLGWLEAGSCATWEGSAPNFMPEGQYFLGAVADPSGFVEETDEGNNTLGGKSLGVGLGPDLVVSEVTAPVSVERDAPFSSQVTVCNQGTEAADGFFRLYLSSDAELSPQEEVYGSGTSTGPLQPGQCATREVQGLAQVGLEGTWYLGAIVESWGWSPELAADNNTRLSAPMGVGSLPDFIVSALTVPSAVDPMTPFTASVTVCNQGTRPGDTDVELSVVQGPEEQPLQVINSFYLGALDAGQCTTQDVSVGLGYLGQGPFYLRARADFGDSRWELIEGNNTRLSERLNLAFP